MKKEEGKIKLSGEGHSKSRGMQERKLRDMIRTSPAVQGE